MSPMSQLFRDYLSHVESAHAGFPIGLLTIGRPGEVDAVLRLATVSDRNVLSRGQTFFASGFDFRLPDRLSEGDQRSAFVLPVIDRAVFAALQAEPQQLAYVLEVVFSWTPDTVEIGPLRLSDVSRAYDASTQTLSIETAYRDVLRNPRPGRKYTPAAYPGLFARPNLQGVLVP